MVKIRNSYLSERAKKSVLAVRGGTDYDLTMPIAKIAEKRRIILPEDRVIKPGAPVERFYRQYQIFQ